MVLVQSEINVPGTNNEWTIGDVLVNLVQKVH